MYYSKWKVTANQTTQLRLTRSATTKVRPSWHFLETSYILWRKRRFWQATAALSQFKTKLGLTSPRLEYHKHLFPSHIPPCRMCSLTQVSSDKKEALVSLSPVLLLSELEATVDATGLPGLFGRRFIEKVHCRKWSDLARLSPGR